MDQMLQRDTVIEMRLLFFVLFAFFPHSSSSSTSVTMPVNPNICDNEVKSCFSCHATCHRKRSVFRTGSFLNQYIETEDEYLSEKLEGKKLSYLS